MRNLYEAFCGVDRSQTQCNSQLCVEVSQTSTGLADQIILRLVHEDVVLRIQDLEFLGNRQLRVLSRSLDRNYLQLLDVVRNVGRH